MAKLPNFIKKKKKKKKKKTYVVKRQKRGKVQRTRSYFLLKMTKISLHSGITSQFMFKEILNKLSRDFYKIDSSFPLNQFVVRSESEKYRTIYFVSSAVRGLLLAQNSSRLKVKSFKNSSYFYWLIFYIFQIINTGVRMFSRNTGASETK